LLFAGIYARTAFDALLDVDDMWFFLVAVDGLGRANLLAGAATNALFRVDPIG
jgi:hypothetical protein